jgi:hypothetical protein
MIDVDRKLRKPAAWTQVSFPTRWHYDILWALDYLRRARVAPDERVAEAVDLVAKKRDEDGRWPLENPHPGLVHFEMEGRAGGPSRWNTPSGTPRAALGESGVKPQTPGLRV